MQAVAALFLPGRDPDDPEVLGRADFLYERIMKRIEIAVQNAIAGALNGK